MSMQVPWHGAAGPCWAVWRGRGRQGMSLLSESPQQLQCHGRACVGNAPSGGTHCWARPKHWHSSSTTIPALIMHRSSNLLCQEKPWMRRGGWGLQQQLSILYIFALSLHPLRCSISSKAGRNFSSAWHRETLLLLKLLIYSLHEHQLLFPWQKGLWAKFWCPGAVTLCCHHGSCEPPW